MGRPTIQQGWGGFKRMSLIVPAGVYDALSVYAGTEKMSRSEVVRIALEEYLEVGSDGKPFTS